MKEFFRLIGDIHGHLRNYHSLAGEVHCSLQVGDMSMDYKKFPDLDPKLHAFLGGNHDNYALSRTDLKVDDPLAIAGDNNYTILGYGENNFAEKWVGFLDELEDEPAVFKFSEMPENHLGNFGIWDIPDAKPVAGGLTGKIFWVRGAWSIDGAYRRRNGAGWWHPREQISIAEGLAALELYRATKPDFVVTHDCPSSVQKNLQLLFSDGKKYPTQTGTLLQYMFAIHKPRLWVFGHYHQHVIFSEEGTTFMCLNMFPEDGFYFDFDENLKPLGELPL